MQRAYLIHALSPLHPGTGQAQGVIDLPIARLRGTGIPFLPGSSVKGVLRDALEEPGQAEAQRKLVHLVFGPPPEDKSESASGAVAFGDARLLALPVRSFHGTFAWVTSPLLLRLARRDLGWSDELPRVLANNGIGSVGVTPGSLLTARGHVFLEELECPVDPSAEAAVETWADKLAPLAMPEDPALFTERLAVVDDETMTFLWEACTQVDARVRINDLGVVEDGALWYEESLPAETLLLGVAAVIRRDSKPERLLDFCLSARPAYLQFGGKATVGRGRARLLAVEA